MGRRVEQIRMLSSVTGGSHGDFTSQFGHFYTAPGRNTGPDQLITESARRTKLFHHSMLCIHIYTTVDSIRECRQ